MADGYFTSHFLVTDSNANLLLYFPLFDHFYIDIYLKYTDPIIKSCIMNKTFEIIGLSAAISEIGQHLASYNV